MKQSEDIRWEALFLTVVIALVTTLCMYGASKPPLNPAEPVFQTNPLMPNFALKLHPGVDEVSPLTAEELRDHWNEQFKRENKEKLWNRGFLFLSIGVPLAIAGFLFSGILAQYGGQMIAHITTPIGIVLSITGAGFMELAETWILVTIGFLLVIAYGVYSYVLRNRGYTVPHPRVLLPRNKPTTPECDTDQTGQ